jgi:hypothetical protein
LKDVDPWDPSRAKWVDKARLNERVQSAEPDAGKLDKLPKKVNKLSVQTYEAGEHQISGRIAVARRPMGALLAATHGEFPTVNRRACAGSHCAAPPHANA